MGMPITVAALVDAAALAYGESTDDIYGRARTDRIVEARQIVCWLAVKYLGMSLSAVGKRMSRDHTVILSARRGIDRRRLVEQRIASRISEIWSIANEPEGVAAQEARSRMVSGAKAPKPKPAPPPIKLIALAPAYEPAELGVWTPRRLQEMNRNFVVRMMQHADGERF